jgi:hypothetical protein
MIKKCLQNHKNVKERESWRKQIEISVLCFVLKCHTVDSPKIDPAGFALLDLGAWGNLGKEARVSKK